jgi:hypothetical protein
VTININTGNPSTVSFMKILKDAGPFKLNWGDNIKKSFANMFMRILNWIGSAQVTAHGGLFCWVGRDFFVIKVMSINWMSKAMKGDVTGCFMIVCSFVIEKDVARTGLAQNIVWNIDREIYFQMKETPSLNSVTGNGMQTIKLVRDMLVALLLH